MNSSEPIRFGPYTITVADEHAQIRRVDGAPPEPTFYELQHMKGIAFGASAIAVEVFPAQADLVDTANIRHLWCVPRYAVRVPCLRYERGWAIADAHHDTGTSGWREVP